MPSPPKPLTTTPSIVEPEEPDASVRPFAPLPAGAPEITTSGAPENPGSVFPSISTGTVIAGRGDANVIVWTPDEPRSNVMILKGTPPESSEVIAARNVPGPLSAVLVTATVDAPFWI